MAMQEEREYIGKRYRIISRLGKGANGSVYLVYDEKLGKRWAAKIMNNHSDSEIMALKNVSSPYFPRIVDTGVDGKGVFIIMDYIEGTLLREYEGGKRAGEKERIKWAISLAQALGSLHNANPSMLYLDCKPDNIIIDTSGELKLVDMGSIYYKDACNPGRISGTAGFASPEQRQGRAVDITSDVYAYGETIKRIVSADGDSILKSVVRRCVAINPEDRYQSMNEIVRNLVQAGPAVRVRKLLMQTLNCIYKSIIALFIILSCNSYNEQKESLFLFLAAALLLLLILPAGNKRDDINMRWTCLEDIHMGRGSKIIAVLLITVLALFTMKKTDAYAAENYRVILYDSKGDKILFRGQYMLEGEDGSVNIYIPTENVTPDSIPVRAECVMK